MVSDLEQALIWQIRIAKMPAPVTELRFLPPRRWRFDLAWPDIMLACEVEGGTWVQGRHSRPQGMTNDCEKYNEALIAGWRVLRVTGDMVSDGRALDYVERAISPVG